MGRIDLIELEARREELTKCVNCGLCQAVCPTYLTDGYEGLTARGKIEIIRGMLASELTPSPQIADLADDCLSCYACKTVCPAGVDTARLWTAMRQDLGKLATTRGNKSRALKYSIGSPALMAAGARRIGRLYGFQREHPQAARLGKFGLPVFNGAPYIDNLQEVYSPVGEPVGRVGLLIGCSGNLTTPWAVDAAITLLRGAGWEVIVPKEQGCCGAPAINNGQWKLARKLAAKTVSIFDSLGVHVVTSPDATCAASMGHDYDNLFLTSSNPPDGLNRFKGKVRPLDELVGDALDKGRYKFHPLKVDVTMHDSCHAVHFGAGKRWRELLKAIPGLNLVEMKESALCCGFGGSYSVMHRRTSDRIAERKMDHARTTGADILLVTSPGCQIRMQSQPADAAPMPQVRFVAELIAGMAV